MDPDNSITCWIDQLKAGDQQAAQPLWERYFQQLVRLARKKLRHSSRAVADTDDVVVSAFKSFCLAAEHGRFPNLRDRDDLWKLLVVITERKALSQVRAQRRKKRGAGRVQGGSVFGGEKAGIDGGGIDNVHGREPSPAFAAQVADEFQRLLEVLDDDTLRLIALSKLEGDTNDQIGRKLSVSLRTVERKLELIRRIWQSRPET